MDIDNKKSNLKSAETIQNEDTIISYRNRLIAGFLSLPEKEMNLPEGGNPQKADCFVRHMLITFWNEKSQSFSEYADIFKRTISAHSSSNTLRSENPRAHLDPTVTGWYEHSARRLQGSICSTFRYNGPFFELLINPMTTIPLSDYQPFTIKILINREIAEKRWLDLKSCEMKIKEAAYLYFYDEALDTPATYIDRYRRELGKDPGPNSMRILKGLEFFSLKKMKSQTAKNCWIKAVKLSVLASLYIETVSNRPELSYQQSWKVSRSLYRKWKSFVYSKIEKMLKNPDVPEVLAKSAKEKIQKLSSKKSFRI